MIEGFITLDTIKTWTKRPIDLQTDRLGYHETSGDILGDIRRHTRRQWTPQANKLDFDHIFYRSILYDNHEYRIYECRTTGICMC